MLSYFRVVLLLLLPAVLFNCERELPSSYNYTNSGSISLLVPKGGERFTVNQAVTVRWSSVNINEKLRIELINDDQSVYSINEILNTGEYIFVVPAEVKPSKDYQLKLLSIAHPEIFDINRTFFEIAPSIDGRWYYSNITELPGFEIELELSTFINDSFTGSGYFHMKYLNRGEVVNYERVDTIAGILSFPEISFVMREQGGKEFNFTGDMITNSEIKGRIFGFIDSTFGALNDTLTLHRQ